MTPDPNHSSFKLTFRIEQLPDGTFVGKSDNPKMEIKGATPQEVQQKIQHSMGARIIERFGIHLAASVTGNGVEVTGTVDTPSAGDPNAQPSGEGGKSQRFGPAEQTPTSTNTRMMIDGKPVDMNAGAAPPPYDGAPNSQQMALRVAVAAATVLVALGWWFLHR